MVCITVMKVQSVLTLREAITAHAAQDTEEMDSTAQVRLQIRID